MKFACGLITIVLLLSPIAHTFARSEQRKVKKQPAEVRFAPIDINTASAEDFTKLPGIGPELARRIVAYREKHGPFRRVEDLLVIRGIGPKKWRTVRPYLRVEQKK
jgi:competence ComEA-like helix-hairpin-helix protein